MNINALLRFFYTFGFVLLLGVSAFAQTTWTFSVVVAVEKQTADYYQKTYNKSIAAIVKAQIDTVNANFNRSTNTKGRFNFQADSVYVFDGPAQNEVFRPHPKYLYNVVINGYSDNAINGGWYGSYRTIYHSWKWDTGDGPFGKLATNSLTHEFAHARGAVDIDGLKVDADKNPVNNVAFQPVKSIMNSPYDTVTWDEHTTNILNTTGNTLIDGETYITKAFPDTIGVKVTTKNGKALGNVKLTLYPVDWYSNAVTSAPFLETSTNDKGVLIFSSNPHQPNINGYPWLIRHPNFLLKATYNGVDTYTWMPFYDVQNSFFKKGAKSAFYTEVQFPESTPVPTITITKISSTTVCPNETIKVTFKKSGTFSANNRFNLHIVDPSDNRFIYSTMENDSTLVGSVPNWSSAVVRVVSTDPYVQGEESKLTIKPYPTAPTVSTLVIVCLNKTASPLEATGQNLRWYTSVSGTASTTAPVPSTSQLGTTAYYVSQTINGCEGSQATIRVTVQTTPTATISGGLTTNLGLAVPLYLTFAGPGPYTYKLTDNVTRTATRDTILLVTPTQSITYRITEVSNSCGVGQATGEAAVTLLVPEIKTGTVSATTVCAGETISATYQTTGTFTSGNTFKLQLAPVTTDTTKINYVDMVTNLAGNGQLSGVVSNTTSAGQYWVRAVATNPQVPILGNRSPTVITVRAKATATLAGNQTITKGQSATLTVAFTGESPWTLVYHDSTSAGIGQNRELQLTTSPYTFTATPTETTAYVVNSVINGCGVGTITNKRVIINVMNPLAINDFSLRESVRIYPVPATSQLTVRIPNVTRKTPASVELLNPLGQAVHRYETTEEISALSLATYPSGSYILRIQLGNQHAARQIIKL